MPRLVSMAGEKPPDRAERQSHSATVTTVFTGKLIGNAYRPRHDHDHACTLTLTVEVLSSKLSFLIDSDADRSLIPMKHVPRTLITACDATLLGVNGQPILVYGQCTLDIAARGLRRVFPVNFIVADSFAILGADFITTAGLQLDMRARKLHDPLTSRQVDLMPLRSTPPSRVYVIEKTSPHLSDFPSLTQPPDYVGRPAVPVSHAIEVTCGPVSCKPRILSPAKFEVAKTEFDKLLHLGIIRPSPSPWASPLQVVEKADGTWRPCGDYRVLNALTKPDRYVIPNIENFHHRLRGASVFSKLDLVKAFYFIPMA